jgi:hypothetical protein
MELTKFFDSFSEYVEVRRAADAAESAAQVSFTNAISELVSLLKQAPAVVGLPTDFPPVSTDDHVDGPAPEVTDTIAQNLNQPAPEPEQPVEHEVHQNRNLVGTSQQGGPH